MAGNNTNQYDFVMEFAEGALSKMLEPLFASDGGLLEELVSKIPGLSFADGVFTIDVLFDRPTTVGLPANVPNPLDVRINLGWGGSSGQIRLIVGLTVDRSKPDEDAIQLDFPNLYWLEATVIAPPLPPITTRLTAVENWLRSKPPLRLPGFHVDRTTTDAMTLKQVDVTVIDDTSSSDSDAVAFCLTFGGGGGIGLNSFTKNFIPGGETGSAAIFFGWMCRIISPKIAESLGVASSVFTNCTLNQSIDVGDGATLTKLDISLDNGYLRLDAEIKKSGFCYDAKGTVSAKTMIKIDSGKLVVSSEIGDPDVDVDIPWYCYLAMAIVGAAVGGFIGGIVGGIVGAIIGPVITYIVQEVLQGVLNKIADAISEKINSGLPNFEVPAYGINFIFQEVQIDDINLVFYPEVIDNAPIRCTGSVVLHNGQGVDLDSGIVGNYDQSGVDLAWMGEGSNRNLQTVCIVQLARTGSQSFDGQTRFSLYRPVYSRQVAIPLSELETTFTIPWPPMNIGVPTSWVYGVITNEGRLAVVQVGQIEDDYIVLRYKTYDTTSPSVRIVGGFYSLSPILPGIPINVNYLPLKPSKSTEERMPILAEALCEKAMNLTKPSNLPVSHAAYLKNDVLRGEINARIHSDIIQRTMTTLKTSQKSFCEAFQTAAPLSCRVGQWIGLFKYVNSDTGQFVARCNRIKDPATYYWYINGTHLNNNTGQVTLGQQIINYEISGDGVTLKATKMLETTFELKVKAVGVDGIDAGTTRCITYKPTHIGLEQTMPLFKDYKIAYDINFGKVATAEVYDFKIA